MIRTAVDRRNCNTGRPWNTAWLMIVLGTVTLCSCRGPQSANPRAHFAEPPGEAYADGTAQVAMAPVPCPIGPPGMEAGVPQPFTPTGMWRPPGMTGPWPEDEYIRDGGVTGPTPQVRPDGQVVGLGMEDSVAHFDTVDGRTLVQPSNPVFLYSPRFSSVRQVVSLVANEQINGSVGMHMPTKVILHDETQRANTNAQNMQARRQIGTTLANQYASKQGTDRISTRLGPQEFQNRFQPYENLTAIRTGNILEGEMAILAKSTAAAVTWKQDSVVQVILDKRSAMAAVSNQRSETVYTVKEPPANPRLRVIKVASSQLLKPGEIVAFTIRFDNIGNQPIGNVTILDNLSTRLEYMPETAQSSLQAQFSTQPNEHGSQVLRWEITPPLEPGKGGIIRFTCHVR